jgi:protease-4
MKSFLSNIVSSFIGVFLASIVLGFLGLTLLIGIFVSIADSFDSGKNIQALNEPSILILRLAYPIQEKTSEDPFDHYDFNTMESRIVLGLDDIIEGIHRAKHDPNIAGIYLNLAPEAHGWATAEAIREALIAFRETNKWVLAYNEIYSHQSYYLSSAASEVYLNPEGYLQLQGLSSQSIFVKDALEKLDIEMQVLRGPNNEYKSAIETFSESEMSDSNRFQTQILLNELWAHITQNISKERDISNENVNLIADKLAIKSATDSVQHKLVDALLYLDQVRDNIRQKMELKSQTRIPAISIEDYAMLLKDENPFKNVAALPLENQIAVVFADGEIMSGDNDRGIVGSITTSYALRKARENPNVKAIVIRINSPGGSALASDVILREVYLSAQHKPTIVSFGDVAASGGYYMSAAAHRIFAEPSTITGSIGVFSLMPNLKGFFNNKLGVNFESVNTNQYSDFGNMSQALKDYEKEHLNQQIINVYQSFKEHVAEGRSMPMEKVEEVAKGRVWSGIAAKRVGLVDELGGLHDAITEAAKLANLSHYELLKLPEEETPFKKLLKSGDEHAQSWLVETFLGSEFLPVWKQQKNLQKISKMEGIQARMPLELLIQ